MQLFLLALILGLLGHDAFLAPPGAATGPDAITPAGGPAFMLALLLGPKLVLAGGYWLSCRVGYRRLRAGRGRWTLTALDRLTMVHRVALLGLFALDLGAGELVWLRHTVGDLVLVDELLLLLPTLATVALSWAAYYPIDRRLREAKLIRRADAGEPIYPIWSRGQFLVAQMRHQMALLLVPLLLVLGWIETVAKLGSPRWLGLAPGTQMALTMLGAVGVFLFAPLIIRHVWDTAPLPAGDIRDRLTRLCEQHRVKVRQLLLWRTYGGMINAAVMGLIGPLRYILLSDALLDQVAQEQVEAVMAHEVAHVRRKHMFWLLAAAGGSIGLIQVAALGWLEAQRWASAHARPGPGIVEPVVFGLSGSHITAIGVFALAALGWVALFGWVSRRFERQADAFAVVHLAHQQHHPWRDEAGRRRVDAASAETMIQALQRVADLNNVPPHRKSWRHGSIRWRQDHLRALIGRRIDDLPIDRQMQWIKRAAAIAAAAALAAELVM